MTQVTSKPRTATRTIKADATIAKAVDQAREAAEYRAGDFGVGEHVGTIAEGERVLTHLFECPHPGYRGWRWAVTMSRALRGRNVTVNEVVLVPGEDSPRPHGCRGVIGCVLVTSPQALSCRLLTTTRVWNLVTPAVNWPQMRTRLNGLLLALLLLSWVWDGSDCCRGRAVTPPPSAGSLVRAARTTRRAIMRQPAA